MIEDKKEHGLMNIIKEGLGHFSKIISRGIFQQVAEGAETVMNNIEERTMRIEKRVVRDLSSLLIIGFGLVFLIFALFSYLKEFLGWSSAVSYFSIGIIIFVIGLILKLNEEHR